tara:strand:+ start:5225 stop:5653 length:429 start_codon:yes stop_codon:yes gene_type:complete
MAVTYDKISFPKIEEKIKFILDDDFTNIYISPIFKMFGNECVQINLESSSSEDLATNFEVRTYDIKLCYYTKADMSDENQNQFVKNRIDKLKKALIDNQVNGDNWAKLEVIDITYNADIDEGGYDDVFKAEFDVLVTNYNQF